MTKQKPKYWQEACLFLSRKDKTMAKLIKKYPDASLTSYAKPFKTLANAIVGQQISVAAAEATWQRLLNLLKNKAFNAKNFLTLSEAQLKEIGLSKQKIQYLKNISTHFINNKINNKYFQNKSSTQIAEELLAIKGIGKWTLEMFQIFYLNEADIFPLGDIGLIKAIENNYPIKKETKDYKNYLENFSKQWQPYRTVATWYLWRTIDAEPVHY